MIRPHESWARPRIPRKRRSQALLNRASRRRLSLRTKTPAVPVVRCQLTPRQCAVASVVQTVGPASLRDCFRVGGHTSAGHGTCSQPFFSGNGKRQVTLVSGPKRRALAFRAARSAAGDKQVAHPESPLVTAATRAGNFPARITTAPGCPTTARHHAGRRKKNAPPGPIA